MLFLLYAWGGRVGEVGRGAGVARGDGVRGGRGVVRGGVGPDGDGVGRVGC